MVRSYIHAGGSDLPFLLGGDLNAEVRANALARFVTMGSFDQIDRYRALQADLESGAALLADRKAAQGAAVEQLNTKRASALKELARLQELQRKREQAAAAQRARAAASAAAASRRTSTSRGVAPQIMGGSWLCPVAGAHAFGNDYGDSRSGGRHHAGNDILATRGTPIVAPVAGTVTVPERLARRSLVLPRGRRRQRVLRHSPLGIRRQRPLSERGRGDRLCRRRRERSWHATPALRDPPRPPRHDQPVPDAERALLAATRPIAARRRAWRRRAPS